MSLPFDVQELFKEIWEADQQNDIQNITTTDFGRPDLEFEYQSGKNWATIDDEPVFFE